MTSIKSLNETKYLQFHEYTNKKVVIILFKFMYIHSILYNIKVNNFECIVSYIYKNTWSIYIYINLYLKLLIIIRALINKLSFKI